MKGNEQTIESLAHRVKALADLLRLPVSEVDVEERERRQILERYAITLYVQEWTRIWGFAGNWKIFVKT